MMLRLVLLAYLTLAGAVQAAPVEVRSGEHEGFTRIIVDLPARADIQIAQTEKVATVSIGNEPIEFDTSRVFERIPRDRLAEIAAGSDPGSLTLQLGCACVVTNFWHGASLLVLDIRPGVPDVIAAEPPETEPVPVTPTQSVATKTETGQTVQVPLDRLRQSRAEALFTENFAPEDKNVPNTTEVGTTGAAPAGVDALAQARERLLEQVGRAASQGLLMPKAMLSDTVNATRNQSQRTQQTPTAAVTPEMPQGSGLEDNINLRAESSMDRDFGAWRALEAVMSDGAACLPLDQIDVASWGTDGDFGAQIGPLRKKLSGEFDRTDYKIVEKLARRYLYFGFGVEAAQVIALLPPDHSNRPVLQDLAAIMDDGSALQPSVLAGQLTCDSPAAFWSLMSYSELPQEQPIDTDAIMRGFSALPPHLRSLHGPALVERLTAAGHSDAAADALRILDRNPETVTPESEIVAAEIALADGPDKAAEAKLQAVAESNAPPSAEALQKIIDLKFKSGEAVSFEQAQLAGSYMHESRGTDDFDDRFTSYVTALAASGAFDLARQEMARLEADLTPEILGKAQMRLSSRLVSDADDMTFLNHALMMDGASLIDAPEVANAMAERLFALGFAEAASAHVAHGVDGDAARPRRILRARIALELGRPRQAEAEILGLDGKDANLLRAEARSQIGQHGAAFHLFSSGDQTERAMREAWLAEDWQVLRESPDPAIAAIAQMAGAEGAPTPEVESAAAQGVLAQNRQLLADSSTIRETVGGLLQSLQIPGDDS